MSQPISLLVHIGHGKTGSTSIQQTLLKNRDAMLERGIAYLGRMLEHCETSEPKEWQHADGAVRLLHQMPADTAGQEIYSVLTEELDRLKTIGVHTAIWSNEAFFARREAVCDALEKLRERRESEPATAEDDATAQGTLPTANEPPKTAAVLR